MEFRHLQWSATTCDFPGAGVYFGLAVPSEHAAVEEACARVAGAQSKPSTAAFLMSIGLPIAREERFFDQIIGSRPAQAWEDFFHLMAAQCKGGE